jgi:hypothetical protein
LVGTGCCHQKKCHVCRHDLYFRLDHDHLYHHE